MRLLAIPTVHLNGSDGIALQLEAEVALNAVGLAIERLESAACHKAKRLHGVMFRLTLSRLEEGLGHEGFQCDKCGERVKYVPEVRS